jgi:hypothetical protein
MANLQIFLPECLHAGPFQLPDHVCTRRPTGTACPTGMIYPTWKVGYGRRRACCPGESVSAIRTFSSHYNWNLVDSLWWRPPSNWGGKHVFRMRCPSGKN